MLDGISAVQLFLRIFALENVVGHARGTSASVRKRLAGFAGGSRTSENF